LGRKKTQVNCFCGKPPKAKDLCSKHYSRLLRHGDPDAVTLVHGDGWERYEAKVDRSGGPAACHPWLGSIDDGGYGSLRFGGQTRRAHQVAWIREHGPIPEGVEIDHQCHNEALQAGRCRPGICLHRRCCNELHLAAKTRAQHVTDTPRVSHVRAKLDEDKIRRILALLAAGSGAGPIMSGFGIGPTTVYRIKTGQQWGWVESPHREAAAARNTSSGLTPGDVREIRRLLAEKTPWKEIAEQFGVSIPTVGSIKRRRTWAWLE
jgi:hypothetical protein